jgi:hypothetical protein
VDDDHDAAHSVLTTLRGLTPRIHPCMGIESESHGPPSLPIETPSFVCQKSLNGLGVVSSKNSHHSTPERNKQVYV